MQSTAYVHPTSLVEGAVLGEGVRIWAWVHVMPGAEVGANTTVGDHTFIDRGARIGSDVTIKLNCVIAERTVIEDGAFIGPGVVFTNDRSPRSPRSAVAAHRYVSEKWLEAPAVRKSASVGAGTVVLPGVVVGEYAMVGAGAVLGRDVPPHGVVAGRSNAIIGYVCMCGAKRGVLEDFGMPDENPEPGDLKCGGCPATDPKMTSGR